MKMKNKITYAAAYRDWLAALGRMWSIQRHYPKSDDYGHAPDPCHGCQWPTITKPNNNYGP